MRRRGITGPIVLITIGLLFAADHIWGWWDFSRTWPVILIVIGAIKLFEHLTYGDYVQQPPQPRPWGGQPPYPPIYPPAPQPPTPPPPPSPLYTPPPTPPGTVTGHPED